MRNVMTAVVLDDDHRWTLGQLCEVCQVSEAWLIELLDEGVIEPVPGPRTEWVFDITCLRRVRRARRLHRDLGVNAPGIALALQLLDELEHLRGRR
ncbi:MAG: chaperone modulator CbpM [Pigmentiphaga sp.]|nr:chaperone modulator CbpM [Pigmentiphaga sp.]